MIDLQKIAQVACEAVKVKEGDLVLVQSWDRADELNLVIVKELQKRGALPLYREGNGKIGAQISSEIKERQLEVTRASAEPLFAKADKIIKVIGEEDPEANKIIGMKEMQLTSKILQPLYKLYENKPWVMLMWPKEAQAKQAGMSLEEFREWNANTILINYPLLKKNAQILTEKMRAAREVRIKGKETDLRFSIKGIGVEVCAGSHNLPDGEVMTAPVRESVEGKVQFNVPVWQGGVKLEEIYLEFEKGRVTKARAKDEAQTARLQEILEMDAGARYTGEFALGINPVIKRAVGEILFDEKIGSSFHIALGKCFPEADNGNESGLHWDLICIQSPEKGGGEIWLDDTLLRKDGKFVPPELQILDEANYSL